MFAKIHKSYVDMMMKTKDALDFKKLKQVNLNAIRLVYQEKDVLQLILKDVLLGMAFVKKLAQMI